jgi:prepilin-type N-terminal cleavage/methylation domain-containing protein
MLPNRRRLRTGFSMIELLIVMVILAIMFAMVAPRVTGIRDSSTLRAGRQQLSAAFSAGRAAALQKGRPSAVIINGNEVTVRVRSGLNNADVQVFGPLRLDVSLGITLQRLDNAPDSVTYSARGLMSNAIAGDDQIFRYRLSYGSKADTLCISAVGLILPKGCTL